MTALVPATPAALAAREVARNFAAQSMSENTIRAYRTAWRHFVAWCASVDVQALPADPVDVASYIASLATTHSAATIDQRLAAIAQQHRLKGLEWNGQHVAIRQTLAGLLREYGRPQKKAAPIMLDTMQALAGACDDEPGGVRDRALLLLGFAGALRRSEIVALLVSEVTVLAGGMRIWIRRSKTNQTGQGEEVAIPRGAHPQTCPVRAMEAWVAMLGEQFAIGPLFRRLSKTGRVIGDRPLQDATVLHILSKRAALAGLTEELRPHGLRAGFITEAAGRGVQDHIGMGHSRHKTWTTYRSYVRPARLLIDSPAGMVGL